MTSKRFSGFPTRMEFTPLPSLFVTEVMPQIEDINELKVTLYIFQRVYHKREYPRFVTYRELLSYGGRTGAEEKTLLQALDSAVERGTILQATLDIDGKTEEAYFINTESDRKALDRSRSGGLPLKGAAIKEREIAPMAQLPNIFALYEQNIGVITPMIAEELKEAERLYPTQWIEEAFKEAVTANKRSWKYIARILERWTNEGKDSGAHRQDIKKGNADKYIRGKYGHLVRR